MKRKANAEIGRRAYDELLRMFPDKKIYQLAKELGCREGTIYFWLEGRAPSAIFLQRMCQLNMDVVYILTGKRQGAVP